MSALRVLVAGGPRVGKSTLAQRLVEEAESGLLIRHTDSLMETLEWSEASAEVARWINQPGPWIIEGVAVPRALRKWLAANVGKPADVIYWSDSAKVPLTRGQIVMSKGCDKVWREIRDELALRDVRIEAF